jgi:hypothetical protein
MPDRQDLIASEAGRDGLFHAEPWRSAIFRKILRVYPEEMKLLAWVTLIQLIMRISSILINNYAQTAFLKRFGVEYLPAIFLIEAFATFFLATGVGALMERHGSVRVFTGLFLFFALSMGMIRWMIPFGFVMIYPVLYILKSQVVEILPILYWDILSDLFTTQQSKRLYTLITAGGVLGTTLGSVLTGPIARRVGIDNVLLIFVVGMVIAALLNQLTERVVGVPIESREDGAKKAKSRKPFRESIAEVIAAVKESALLRYMVIITAIPNILLPWMTYQFNVAMDNYYASEQGVLSFLGLFRGISNGAMFVILLFSGRLISRWGVGTSLLFHPCNYLISFAAIFFRFDLITAVYARFTTETLKTTLNNPARAILFNFLPPNMRGMIRVFLRGTVVRASDFAGSGFLMLTRGIIEPRILSIVAAPLALIWIWTSVKLKRQYPSLLAASLARPGIDLTHFEDDDFGTWISDQKSLQTVVEGLKDSHPQTCLACAEILAKAAPKGWASWIVEVLPEKDPATQKVLLDFLRPEDSPDVMHLLVAMARSASPPLLALLLSTLRRLDAGTALPLMKEMSGHPDPDVLVESVSGLLLSNDPEGQSLGRQILDKCLEGDENSVQTAAEIVARTGHVTYTQMALGWMDHPRSERRAAAIRGLLLMEPPDTPGLARTGLRDPAPIVRRATAEGILGLGEKAPIEWLTDLLSHEDAAIRGQTVKAIRQRERSIPKALFPLLASPSRTARTEALAILREIEAPFTELAGFIRQQLETPYRHLSLMRAVKSHEGRAFRLLERHLMETNVEIQEVVLRVLGHSKFPQHMGVILKALYSGDRRSMDNAVEFLETSLPDDLRKMLIPLLEERPLEEKLAAGRRAFKTEAVPLNRPEGLLKTLWMDEDPLTRALIVYALGETHGQVLRGMIEASLASGGQVLQDAAHWLAAKEGLGSFPAAGSLEEALHLVHRIEAIGNVPLFANLNIRELAALAMASTSAQAKEGEIIIREGESGRVLYILLTGQAAVIKGWGTSNEMILDWIEEKGFFGEMALIDGQPRSATIRVTSAASLLVLRGEDLTRLISDYPTIPIRLCNVLCQRIRTLHQRLTVHEGPGG